MPSAKTFYFRPEWSGVRGKRSGPKPHEHERRIYTSALVINNQLHKVPLSIIMRGAMLFRFRFQRPFRGYAELCQVNAVLTPVFGLNRKQTGQSILARAGAISRWQRDSLQARNVAGVLSAEQLDRLGNCRHAFGLVIPKTNYCNQAHLCVHCWARRATEVWSRIDYAMSPVREDGSRPRRSPYSLVVTSRVFGPLTAVAYKGEGGAAGVVAARASRVRAAAGEPIDGRGYEMRKLAPAGAVNILTLSPHYASPRGWDFRLRQVLAVDPASEFVLPGARIRRFESPTRKRVARAVAWAWRYPRGLLLAPGGGPASPTVVSKYLEAIAGRRLWAGYGMFNERRAEEAGESGSGPEGRAEVTGTIEVN